ncbi:MAG: ADP-ribosylglycohydrolase [Granulosicoccus sp.]|jgi:ADP-ribosylglycohydrolase
MNKLDALNGALVADAASMGLHWLYDQDQIQALQATGDIIFRHPDFSVYENRKAFFAHSARRSGQLSHYGESARIVGQLALEGQYTPQNHQQAFMASFGPCGSYVGYADRPTKSLIARIITDGEHLLENSGIEDDQLPALCVLPGLFAANAQVTLIEQAATVISTHSHVNTAAKVILNCLNAIAEGESLPNALEISARTADPELASKLSEALNWSEYQPLAVSKHFGMACKVHQGLPVVWHLLKHVTEFEGAVRDNTLCGGDSCGRAMVLGAIAGYVFGVPSSMIGKLTDARIPINFTETETETN